MIALIGGYGLEKMLKSSVAEQCEAAFEDEKINGKAPHFEIYNGHAGDKSVIVVPRHGAAHDLPPHNVPYKSIMKALKEKGASALITVNSVGIMNPKMGKGSFILLRDFVNFGKEMTFFERFNSNAMHVSMRCPYDERINNALEKTLAKSGAAFHVGAVYVNSHGPRLETAEEIRKKYGPLGDVIGMTGAYEAMLARELGIPMATICIGANYAEGCGENPEFADIKKSTQSMQAMLFSVLEEAIKLL